MALELTRGSMGGDRTLEARVSARKKKFFHFTKGSQQFFPTVLQRNVLRAWTGLHLSFWDFATFSESLFSMKVHSTDVSDVDWENSFFEAKFFNFE